MKHRIEETYGMIYPHTFEGPITQLIEYLHEIIRTKGLKAAAEGFSDLSLDMSHDYNDQGEVCDTFYEIVGYRDETSDEKISRLEDDKRRDHRTFRYLKEKYGW